jgi:hypothetical protein
LPYATDVFGAGSVDPGVSQEARGSRSNAPGPKTRHQLPKSVTGATPTPATTSTPYKTGLDGTQRVSASGPMREALLALCLATACSSGTGNPTSGVEIPGPAGQPGARGPMGPTGPQGATGAPGPGITRPTLVDSVGQVVPTPYVDPATGYVFSYAGDSTSFSISGNSNITVLHEGTTCEGNRWLSIPPLPNLYGAAFDYTKVVFAPIEPMGAYLEYIPGALSVPPVVSLPRGNYSYWVLTPNPPGSSGMGDTATCQPFPVPPWTPAFVPGPVYAPFSNNLDNVPWPQNPPRFVPPVHYEMR